MNKLSYKYLKTYMLATVTYDLTNEFCSRYISRFSRTFDQMIQAGRSGKQNIAEGYEEESLKSYIKLLGVARASITELREDFEDFLRQRKLEIWPKDDSKIRVFREFRVRWVGDTPTTLNTPTLPNNPEQAANMLITFCNQEEYLLSHQIESLKEKFIKEGGWTENLRKKRIQWRNTKGDWKRCWGD